jgi:hypothetical protein
MVKRERETKRECAISEVSQYKTGPKSVGNQNQPQENLSKINVALEIPSVYKFSSVILPTLSRGT